MLAVMNFAYLGLWAGPWLRDVAGYEGKITLISVGFGEAAVAANNAIAKIRGEKVQPKYSTD